ncbi:TIGR01906 family membrane protein [Arthrobacter sp. B0490]|uniref:TIGR01906 family membrane protein n=1 Tax=Arthrobacter sp. B0490 TaxID=2058891 RepID=UPI00215755E0|nr:TIGR01906 family membrane protein [Arthrobacter sp. B0490]
MRRADDSSIPAEDGAAGRDDQPASGVAQRHDLPRRKAGTMPDLSGVTGEDPADDTLPDSASDSAHDRADASSTPESASGSAPDSLGDSAPDSVGDRHPDDSDARPSADTSSGGTVAGDASSGDGGGTATRMMPAVPGASAAGATAAGAAPATATPRTGATTPSAAPSADGVGTAASDEGPQGTDTSDHSPARADADADARPAPDHRPAAAAGAAAGAAAVAAPSSSGRGSSGSREPSTDTASLSASPPDKDAARRAAVRDQAVAAKPVLPRFLQVVVALFFPVVVVAAAVRAVATSSFLWLEYHRPGFPDDQYGFSLDDRMTYGSYALDYVLNFAPARYLGGLVTPEGEPLFLESEVGHMADVKGVLGLSFFVALVLFVLSVVACVYLARRYKGGIRRALFAGAVLTLVGIAALTVLAVLAWETFFTQVHALFFADGSWTFRVDDTLIRLFPEQFWTDSAITVAVLVLGATLLTLILTWPTKARRERSMLAQDAAQARNREALEAS